MRHGEAPGALVRPASHVPKNIDVTRAIFIWETVIVKKTPGSWALYRASFYAPLLFKNHDIGAIYYRMLWWR